MITDKKKQPIILIFSLLFCLITEAFLEYLLHKRFIFLWDDLWYSTNLVTNQPINNLHDIWESQYWHYFNWGGRSITHGLLQFILFHGELFANLLNLIATFTLSYFICKLAGAKSLLIYSISFFALIALNTDIKLSMFWQSGSANYLYSTNWILLFLLVYLREVKDSNSKPLGFITLWILPLGLITGWSNENMGPACFLSALMTTLYIKYGLKKKTPLWMWGGILTSLLGSVLMITAPGNFIRSSHGDSLSLGAVLYERFFMMLSAGMSYLFPSILCLLLFLYLYWQVGNRLQPYQMILMLTAVLAYGAMVLSPTFPNRACFGIMTLCIVLICSFMKGIIEKDNHYTKGVFLFSLCLWLLGMYDLLRCFILPL